MTSMTTSRVGLRGLTQLEQSNSTYELKNELLQSYSTRWQLFSLFWYISSDPQWVTPIIIIIECSLWLIFLLVLIPIYFLKDTQLVLSEKTYRSPGDQEARNL